MTNFEIVLANGTVVNANSTSNPDLFKAQKGGSGNLGFVTRVDQSECPWAGLIALWRYVAKHLLEVVNSTDIWGGATMYSPSEREDVFSAYVNFADNMDQDAASQNIVGMSWGPHRGYVYRAILTNSAAISDAPAFDEYRKIQNVSSTSRVAPVAEIVPEFTGPTPLGQ